MYSVAGNPDHSHIVIYLAFRRRRGDHSGKLASLEVEAKTTHGTLTVATYSSACLGCRGLKQRPQE